MLLPCRKLIRVNQEAILFPRDTMQPFLIRGYFNGHSCTYFDRVDTHLKQSF